ncbi:heme uptake protein IsdC [Paenibacillus sp. 481]|uniref:heme uptake protein IsdC n=1 Tax=Paenibacillus sp. 481 TaxID=2835869 RepID=UPI001E4ADCBB|nr:heme uptake protein IsdC [Paenibacillus sp. 481]UHA74490.1 heme uptake protein IsdC [Paenibacillus sp. 481]
MRKTLAIPVSMLTVVCMLVSLFITPNVQAAKSAKLADGIYSIDYTIKKAENDSVSMANDYFEKPAKVIVKNGSIVAQIQLNHSKWITEFKVPVSKDKYVDTKVVSSDSKADTRLAQLNVKDLSTPLISKIHVTVESINYDHDYTIRFVFDTKSMKPYKAGSSKSKGKSGKSSSKSAKKKPDAKSGVKATAQPNVKSGTKSEKKSSSEVSSSKGNGK